MRKIVLDCLLLARKLRNGLRIRERRRSLTLMWFIKPFMELKTKLRSSGRWEQPYLNRLFNLRCNNKFVSRAVCENPGLGDHCNNSVQHLHCNRNQCICNHLSGLFQNKHISETHPFENKSTVNKYLPICLNMRKIKRDIWALRP